MTQLLYIIAFFGFMSFGNFHDFHLSKTDIHYKSEQKALQITVHSFIDDIEEALGYYKDQDLNFLEDSELAEADSMFVDYLKEHIRVRVNGELHVFEYLGKEASDDIQGVYSYLELLDIEAIETLEISNTLLMDIFEDQKNIISVKADNDPKAFEILTRDHNVKKIKF